MRPATGSGRRLRRVAAILAVALAAVCLPFALVGELPGERWLSAADAGALGFALTGAGLLAADVALPVPSSIVGTLMGARLGFAAGFAWALAGLLAGNVAGYALGRLWPARYSAAAPAAPGLLLLFASRPVPVLAETLVLAAGATRVPFGAFLLAATPGSALYAAALAGNGAALLPDALLGAGLVVPMLLPAAGWGVWQLVQARAQPRETAR